MSELSAVTIQATVGQANDAVVVQIDAHGWDHVSFPVSIFPVETHNAVPPDTSSTLGNNYVALVAHNKYSTCNCHASSY